ncbi:hypothetical protein E8D34_01170 [Nocardioides sp. GY 10113]|uniref:hypothetical protein n=1 Tax=Nocardioides sp. GY 10113 TaxID=2569761 RepID=UPI0010A89AD6|nr:hypothetical protein [Nocardioides sp. GY 10113]TIC89142.1 hypothetical protein E8D34_01170 [Nocardioides sp. GY 10113]
MGSGRRVAWALVLVAVLVNLPLADHLWSQVRLHRSGVETTAQVVSTRVVGARAEPHYVLQFRYDGDVDPDRQIWPIEVDRPAYLAAESDGWLRVRVVPDRLSAYTVEGAVTGSTGWVVLLVVDALLVALAAVLWWARRVGRWRPGEPEDPERPDPSRPF